jgi:hypothetical protein
MGNARYLVAEGVTRTVPSTRPCSATSGAYRR